MDQKSLYQRFRAWQQDPFKKDGKPAKSRHCAGCGTDYVGKYCPECGQKYDIGKVDWHTLWDDLKGIIGLDKPQSFVSFLVQLFGRPGYMIGDYIGGRRKVYSQPIGMLGLFAAAAVAVGKLTQNTPDSWIASLAEGEGVVGSVLNWLSSNLEWAVLIQTVLLIFPTWLLFRHSPKHPRHTWPEGIYIQVFMGSLVLVCIILRELVGSWVLALVPVFYYIAYKQLFGYGVWGTLWRTLLALGSVIYTIGVIMMGIACLSGKVETDLSTAALTVLLTLRLFLGAVALYMGYRIDRGRKP